MVQETKSVHSPFTQQSVNVGAVACTSHRVASPQSWWKKPQSSHQTLIAQAQAAAGPGTHVQALVEALCRTGTAGLGAILPPCNTFPHPPLQ